MDELDFWKRVWIALDFLEIVRVCMNMQKQQAINLAKLHKQQVHKGNFDLETHIYLYYVFSNIFMICLLVLYFQS